MERGEPREGTVREERKKEESYLQRHVARRHVIPTAFGDGQGEELDL
jgi:hypothetical protein